MKKSLLLAVASLAVISCSKRDISPVEPNSEPNLVRFSSGNADTKVATLPSDEKVNVFEVNDEIGVYAVFHGKKIDASDAFPTNPMLQYKNKNYKVSAVAAATPYTADFVAGSDADKIFYLPGGQGYNYYAYYPTVTLTGKTMNTSYVFEDPATSITGMAFQAQTSLFSQDAAHVVTKVANWPGPMMYAYYTTEDKAPTGGAAQTAVPLAFKIANAKIMIQFAVDKSAGDVPDISSVELYAKSGLKTGYTFDLKQADESTPNVVAQYASGVVLDGTGTGSSTLSYKFQPLIDSTLAETTLGVTSGAHSIGYLIPATAIEDAIIRVTIGSGNSAQVFKAYLDKSATGTGGAAGGTNYLSSIEAGKLYKFKVTIARAGVQFTGTIEDWTLVDNTSDPIPAE